LLKLAIKFDNIIDSTVLLDHLIQLLKNPKINSSTIDLIKIFRIKCEKLIPGLFNKVLLCDQSVKKKIYRDFYM